MSTKDDVVEMSDLFVAVASPEAARTKRDAILAAATRVFLGHGYDGTSMERVAEEAGAARRTLYNQFPDGKESLFRAMIERVWNAYPVLEITGDAAAQADPEVGLQRIGAAVTAFWAPPLAVAFLRMVIAEGTRFPDLARDYFAYGKTPAMGALRDYIEEQARAGRLNVQDGELAARQFLGMINESTLWLRVIGLAEEVPPEQRRRVVDEAVALFLKYYRA